MRESSWSKPHNNNINFIGRRKVVSGLFERGTAIAIKYIQKFIDNLSEDLTYGCGIDVKIAIDNKEFVARIDRPKSHSEESMYMRFFFKKELKDYLNNKVTIELYDQNELYLDFYVGDEKDKFKLEVVDLNKLKESIFQKQLDYSCFTGKATIPVTAVDTVLNNLSFDLIKSGRVPVTLLINDKKFVENVVRPNLTDGRDVKQITFDKKLKEYLSKEFNTSYQYIMQNRDESGNKRIKVPDELKEYMEFYLGEEKDTFLVKLIKAQSDDTTEDEEDIDTTENTPDESEIITSYDVEETVNFIYTYITQQGYTYDKSLIKNICLSLKTKPFLILSGISGTGKSKIIELFAKALGATAENERFNLIPVKPDWSDSTDLLGYRNIEGKFTPGVITKVCYNAMLNKEVPYFVVLDEMNLARVEYYFSDVLSLMETREVNEEGEIITNNLLNRHMLESTDSDAFNKYGDVYLPDNVYIIGTVNMDETTFPFSRKVLDRANTIEFNKVDLNYDFDAASSDKEEPRILHNDFLKSKFLKIKDCAEFKEIAGQVIKKLIDINNILEKYNYHFAYRVRDEITFYIIYAVRDKLFTFEEALDICIVQKILPKISGSSNECFEAVIDLFEYLNDYKFTSRMDLTERELDEAKERTFKNLTNEKLDLMIRRFIKDGFTSFW